ncbi:DNA replication protein DnaD, partial [Enterococcus cecorum]|nr:DNA replication protein DnaD [Enterococcus cecorum]
MLREFQEAGQTVVSNLILDYYQKIGMNNEEFIIWLQLYRYVQEGNRFPDASVIAEKLNLP